MRDVFLCHASDDKRDVVRPLHDALRAAGISSWLDEAEIRWGDSVIDKINDGLRDSRFVIVVLSMTFVKKPWPQRELASALSAESSTGHIRVLPLLVGDPHERDAILNQLPLLRDKLHLTWERDTTRVVEAMRRRLDGSEKGDDSTDHTFRALKSELVYCSRCGIIPGKSTRCTLGYAVHAFTTGKSEDFCSRCGVIPGIQFECALGYAVHAFKTGTGKEFCTRCGTKPGTRTECALGYAVHEFKAC